MTIKEIKEFLEGLIILEPQVKKQINVESKMTFSSSLIVRAFQNTKE